MIQAIKGIRNRLAIFEAAYVSLALAPLVIAQAAECAGRAAVDLNLDRNIVVFFINKLEILSRTWGWAIEAAESLRCRAAAAASAP